MLLEGQSTMRYVLLFLFSIPNIAFACSWAGDPTGGVPYEKRVVEYIKNADYVFLGTIEKHEWKPNPQWGHDNPWHFHKIKVIEQYPSYP